MYRCIGTRQRFIGVGIDLQGARRTLCAAVPLAIRAAALSALAPGFGALPWGPVPMDVGCAPAF